MTMPPPHARPDAGSPSNPRAVAAGQRPSRVGQDYAPALVVAGLEHAFADAASRLPVLSGVSLELPEGSFASLIGPSGCGKSTLIRCCAGLLHPDHGEILVSGKPPRDAQRVRSIGVVFQDAALLPWRTVRRNVALPLEIAGTASPAAAVDNLLELVGLAGFGDYLPDQLSGGMKQRAALARALVLKPSLLLMDEPFAALDEITRAELREELLRIWRGRQATVLLVTHSITDAVLLSDRVLVMSHRPGKIVADMSIDLPRPRDGAMEFQPAFLQYAAALRQLLRQTP